MTPVFPDWLIGAFAFVLPWVYQNIIAKLTSKWKVVVSAILTFSIVMVYYFITHITFATASAAFAWLMFWMNVIYNLLYKPAIFPKVKAFNK